MKITQKQRIALEFLAEVGPLWATPQGAERLFESLETRGLVAWRNNYLHITKHGREALKEAQK